MKKLLKIATVSTALFIFALIGFVTTGLSGFFMVPGIFLALVGVVLAFDLTLNLLDWIFEQ